MANEKIVHISADNFDTEVLNSSEPVVIDFWAPWCGPCKAIAPVLDELADTYDGKVKVAKINIDEEQGLAQAFGVRGIPTLYGMVGKEVRKHLVGFGGKRKIAEMFSELAEMKPDLAKAAG
jgi:thioredoxin 1